MFGDFWHEFLQQMVVDVELFSDAGYVHVHFFTVVVIQETDNQEKGFLVIQINHEGLNKKPWENRSKGEEENRSRLKQFILFLAIILILFHFFSLIFLHKSIFHMIFSSFTAAMKLRPWQYPISAWASDTALRTELSAFNPELFLFWNSWWFGNVRFKSTSISVW